MTHAMHDIIIRLLNTHVIKVRGIKLVVSVITEFKNYVMTIALLGYEC